MQENALIINEGAMKQAELVTICFAMRIVPI
ncbi:hypothetical protein BSPWISOXPB_4367 [uncultured Gammaproteobacteria bacterium]|nr:hypothetical protein BSPWISOXPB_4367 [uncultured Gammaproteobacteria bacterium]